MIVSLLRPGQQPRRLGITTGLREGPIETMKLVARIRRYRGRLTIPQIVKDLGFKDGSGHSTVYFLCQKYEIITAATAPQSGRPPVNAARLAGERERSMRVAQEELKRQIDLAVREASTAPPYRSGPLGWDEELRRKPPIRELRPTS